MDFCLHWGYWPMTDEKEIKTKFAAAMKTDKAKLVKLPTASKLALPQPASMAVFAAMREACSYRCGAHSNCCAHPKKQVREETGSCQFAHCPLLEAIINAK